MALQGARAEDLFPVGHVLNGTYRIERLLGQGGMASVFEVSHVRLPRRFALKVITAPTAQSADFLLRFRREAEILASLDHPNLVQVIDWHTTPAGQPYLVMELLAGEDLSQMLARSGSLPLKVSLSIFTQAASALEVAHQYGITHRDLKPANIYLCRNGLVPHYTKVLDFGIAKSAQHASALVTDHLVLMGTPAYMAPEQARGDLAGVDPRSDQFSLALVLYEMLAGVSAFYRRGEPALNTLCRIMMDEPLPLKDPVMNQAVMRALRKQPDERYPSLSDLVAAVTAAASLPPELIELPERTDRITTRAVREVTDKSAGARPDTPTAAAGSFQSVAKIAQDSAPPPTPSPASLSGSAPPPVREPPSLFSNRSGELLNRIQGRQTQLGKLLFWGIGLAVIVLILALWLRRPPAAAPVQVPTPLPADMAQAADLSHPAPAPMPDLAEAPPERPLELPRPVPRVHTRIALRVSGIPAKGKAAQLVQWCIRETVPLSEQRRLTRAPIELGLGVDRYMHVTDSRLSGDRSLQVEQCLGGLGTLLPALPAQIKVFIFEERIP